MNSVNIFNEIIYSKSAYFNTHREKKYIIYKSEIILFFLKSKYFIKNNYSCLIFDRRKKYKL